MSQFELTSFVEEIVMKVNNKMSDFIRQKVCETDPCLKEYDFNIDKIADAINKQIPKKPKVQKTAYFCPVCSTNVGFRLEEESGLLAHYGKYCEICGQAIDWSEEKENYEKRRNKE